MALPTAIANVLLTNRGYFHGPFLSSGGNVYVVLLNTADVDNTIGVYKATDPTSSFSQQDAANNPAAAPLQSGTLWAHQDGDVLSIAAGKWSSTPAYTFHQFSMATDTWHATIKDKAIASPTTVATGQSAISVQKRTDGSFVAVFVGQKEAIMGTSYNRVVYSLSTDGGATWSAATAVSPTGVEVSHTLSISVVGAADRVHIFYLSGTSQCVHRSLSSTNVLDTAANASTTVYPAPGVAYVSGANTVVKVPIRNGSSKLTSVWFNSQADPTINADADYSEATVAFLGFTTACNAIDGTTTHSVWSDATSTDLMHDSQADGGAWGTDINEWAATINRVSANIYTRSGSKVLAVIMDDGGTIKYNEISLATPAEGLVFTGQATLRVPTGIFAKTVQAQFTLGS